MVPTASGWGSKGSVSKVDVLYMILSKCIQSRLWCIEGDGSLLMKLGSLSTIANNQPSNLTQIVIYNGS